MPDSFHWSALSSAIGFPRLILLLSTLSASPWPSALSPEDFSQLWCRQVHLEIGRLSWQLRDYARPLVEATEALVVGPLVVASRRAVDKRSQRETPVVPGAPWSPASITIVRHVCPNKFFYNLTAGLCLAHCRANDGHLLPTLLRL